VASDGTADFHSIQKACEDSDPNNSHRAVPGLGHGVPEDYQEMVAESAVDLFKAPAQNDLLGQDLS
jgi:hypothetical protein